MSTARRTMSIALLIFAFSLIMPSFSSAASYIGGNISTLSVTSSSLTLSFSGASGNMYKYFLEVELPAGVPASSLRFGSATKNRPLFDWDCVNYVGNVVTVEFAYRPDPNATQQVIGLYAPSGVDLSSSRVVSYGVYGIRWEDVQGSPMLVYDKILAGRQWSNYVNLPSGIQNNLRIQSETGSLPSYQLNTLSSSVVTGLTSVTNPVTGETYVTPIMGSALSSASLSKVNSFDTYVSSSQLVGTVSLQSSLNTLADEWGQFLSRASVIKSLTVNSDNSFRPGDFYFPYTNSLTIVPSNGSLNRVGQYRIYFSVVININDFVTSVSVEGAELENWSYMGDQLVLSCRYDFTDDSQTLDLSTLTFNIGLATSNYPFTRLSGFMVSGMDDADMLAQSRQNSFFSTISKKLDSIIFGINGFFSGLTTGYNEDTSDDLNSMSESTSILSDTVIEYVDAENQVVDDTTQYITDFSPDPSSFLELAQGFMIVGTLTNRMVESSGQYKFLITFILTFGIILFVLQIRRS